MGYPALGLPQAQVSAQRAGANLGHRAEFFFVNFQKVEHQAEMSPTQGWSGRRLMPARQTPCFRSTLSPFPLL